MTDRGKGLAQSKAGRSILTTG